MTITSATKYDAAFQHAEPYLSDESIKELKQAAWHTYGDAYGLAFVDFLRVCEGDFSPVWGKRPANTVLQVYWAKRFADFQQEFKQALENTEVKPTIEQKRAAEGLPQQTFAESMLVFGRAYFGLHSFHDAERLTLGDLIIARKDAYATAMYRRKEAAIEREKFRHSRKK